MGKQFPGKIVSKYNDVNKYEYNATTNPGPLSIGGDDPPIKNGCIINSVDRRNFYQCHFLIKKS